MHREILSLLENVHINRNFSFNNSNSNRQLVTVPSGFFLGRGKGPLPPPSSN